jgi:hypothetical protein
LAKEKLYLATEQQSVRENCLIAYVVTHHGCMAALFNTATATQPQPILD